MVLRRWLRVLIDGLMVMGRSFGLTEALGPRSGNGLDE
jgi:hypothetical protein